MIHGISALSGAIVAALFAFAGVTDKYDNRCKNQEIQIIQGKMYRCVEVKTVEKDSK